MIHAAGMKVIAGTAISLLAFLSPCAYAQDTGFYEYKKASRDGIGKFYMGREISHVMGHLGAAWLERPQRDREEKTSRLVKNLPLESDDTVADIGAGTGYFSFRIADRIQQGKVLAVDIQQEMLDVIQSRIAEGFPKNVEPVLGTERDPRLAAESIDLVLLVDAYHEFSWPREMGEAMAAELPVVASQTGCLGEWLETTGGGLGVEPRNPQALAEALQTMIDQPEQAAAMAARGKAAIYERHTSNAMAEAMLKVFSNETV